MKCSYQVNSTNRAPVAFLQFSLSDVDYNEDTIKKGGILYEKYDCNIRNSS
jgi:hypothetical protein